MVSHVFRHAMGLAMAAVLMTDVAAAQPPSTKAAGPVVVVETSKGVFEFETYPADAPKTVARILELVKQRFYNGQRVHRVVNNFVIQWGDPQTRDMTKKEHWGRGGSGKPMGVVETKRRHVKGAVAMANLKSPADADSQIYVTLADTSATRALDGKYTVFGAVISGMDVVAKIAVDDRIVRMTIKP